jgi:GrpB-like predicted nucleotidyltransferase (UPF0157 family)
MFEAEAAALRELLPADLVGRVEHFGSTAVPGLAAKPIIDVLVEVTSLDEARERAVPTLEAEGYEYVWRPTFGDDGEPWYTWFIKRDPASGVRTHHIHMVEPAETNPAFSEHWERLLFRDHLREHQDVAEEYGALKQRLAPKSPNDRVAYTQAKTAFIARVMADARASR